MFIPTASEQTSCVVVSSTAVTTVGLAVFGALKQEKFSKQCATCVPVETWGHVGGEKLGLSPAPRRSWRPLALALSENVWKWRAEYSKQF